MAETKYRRLTRARARSIFAIGLMSRSSLWLGDDHLLCVDSTGFSETYKRFYFRDIQAVIIQKTERRFIWNIFLGVPLGFCIAEMATSRTLISPTMIISIVFGAIFGASLLFNNLFGPTCACQLRTAVQTEELPSFCRLRQTCKVLDKIRPFITAAQGQVSAEAISAQMRETIQSSPSSSNVTPQPSATGISGVPPTLS